MTNHKIIKWNDLSINDCPRCGGEIEIFSLADSGYTSDVVKCRRCPVSVMGEGYGIEKLIEVWNELG